MYIHEDQAKGLLAEYGVPVLPGQVAYSFDEAVKKAELLSGDIIVMKARVHTGGRGKGGGIALVQKDKVKEKASEMLGMTLVTKQTGTEGKVGPIPLPGGVLRDRSGALFLSDL